MYAFIVFFFFLVPDIQFTIQSSLPNVHRNKLYIVPENTSHVGMVSVIAPKTSACPASCTFAWIFLGMLECAFVFTHGLWILKVQVLGTQGRRAWSISGEGLS